MPAGLQIFTVTGTLSDDISTKFSRNLGSVAIPAVRPETVTSHSGSVVVPEANAGEIYWYFTMGTATVSTWVTTFYPEVSISGNTLTWAYSMLGNEVDRVMLSEMFVYIGGITLVYGRYV